MDHCLSKRNDIVSRHFICYTWGLRETTLSAHIKASALQISCTDRAASGSKVFSGTLVANFTLSHLRQAAMVKGQRRGSRSEVCPDEMFR